MIFIPSLTLEVKVIISWLMAQWLALHSRPVFRDGFLLAYTMWCWNSCWVGSALSFPVGFSSNSKKEAPNGVPGTSERSVPTLTGEGINTHTCYLLHDTWSDTCYLLPYTCYLIFATCHLILYTQYLILDTCFLICVTWYLLPDNCYLLLVTWFIQL